MHTSTISILHVTDCNLVWKSAFWSQNIFVYVINVKY